VRDLAKLGRLLVTTLLAFIAVVTGTITMLVIKPGVGVPLEIPGVSVPISGMDLLLSLFSWTSLIS
jgi:hypothetical protein